MQQLKVEEREGEPRSNVAVRSPNELRETQTLRQESDIVRTETKKINSGVGKAFEVEARDVDEAAEGATLPSAQPSKQSNKKKRPMDAKKGSKPLTAE